MLRPTRGPGGACRASPGYARGSEYADGSLRLRRLAQPPDRVPFPPSPHRIHSPGALPRPEYPDTPPGLCPAERLSGALPRLPDSGIIPPRGASPRARIKKPPESEDSGGFRVTGNRA